MTNVGYITERIGLALTRHLLGRRPPARRQLAKAVTDAHRRPPPHIDVALRHGRNGPIQTPRDRSPGSSDEGGHWVTIRGHHTFISDDGLFHFTGPGGSGIDPASPDFHAEVHQALSSSAHGGSGGRAGTGFGRLSVQPGNHEITTHSALDPVHGAAADVRYYGRGYALNSGHGVARNAPWGTHGAIGEPSVPTQDLRTDASGNRLGRDAVRRLAEQALVAAHAGKLTEYSAHHVATVADEQDPSGRASVRIPRPAGAGGPVSGRTTQLGSAGRAPASVPPASPAAVATGNPGVPQSAQAVPAPPTTPATSALRPGSQRLFNGMDLQGHDFRNRNLDGWDLSDLDLSGADFDGAQMNDANLSGANLEGAHLVQSSLPLATLQGANLAGANLSTAWLADANLMRANLAGANLGSANLRGARLCGADLAGALMEDADVENADLRGATGITRHSPGLLNAATADWGPLPAGWTPPTPWQLDPQGRNGRAEGFPAGWQASLTGGAAIGALLRQATGSSHPDSTFRDLPGADLAHLTLTGRSFAGTNFRGANLTGADLDRADFLDANLGRANLTGASLVGATLTGAHAERADFSGADLTGANLRRTILRHADLTNAICDAADFQGADVHGADFRGASGVDATTPGLINANDAIWGAAQPASKRPSASPAAPVSAPVSPPVSQAPSPQPSVPTSPAPALPQAIATPAPSVAPTGSPPIVPFTGANTGSASVPASVPAGPQGSPGSGQIGFSRPPTPQAGASTPSQAPASPPVRDLQPTTPPFPLSPPKVSPAPQLIGSTPQWDTVFPRHLLPDDLMHPSQSGATLPSVALLHDSNTRPYLHRSRPADPGMVAGRLLPPGQEGVREIRDDTHGLVTSVWRTGDLVTPASNPHGWAEAPYNVAVHDTSGTLLTQLVHDPAAQLTVPGMVVLGARVALWAHDHADATASLARKTGLHPPGGMPATARPTRPSEWTPLVPVVPVTPATPVFPPVSPTPPASPPMFSGAGLDFRDPQVRSLPPRGGHLQGADLSGANMSRLDLSGRNLDGANLTNAHLVRTNLSGADLAGTIMNGANLVGANLSRSAMEGAFLAGANLANADLSGAGMMRADLSRAQLHGATFEEANLEAANLLAAQLDDVDLMHANLRGADLSFARLVRANLTGANLTGTDLHGADLTGAITTGVDFSVARNYTPPGSAVTGAATGGSDGPAVIKAVYKRPGIRSAANGTSGRASPAGAGPGWFPVADDAEEVATRMSRWVARELRAERSARLHEGKMSSLHYQIPSVYATIHRRRVRPRQREGNRRMAPDASPVHLTPHPDRRDHRHSRDRARVGRAVVTAVPQD